MYIIKKEFKFEASHQLKNLPKNHACGNLHGHSYKVIVTLRRPSLNQIGFVRDYGELDIVKDWIKETLDHKHLNDVFDFNPTAENIAHYLFTEFIKTFPELQSVAVKETEKTYAEYSGN